MCAGGVGGCGRAVDHSRVGAGGGGATFCFVCRCVCVCVYFESRVKSAGRQMECAPACPSAALRVLLVAAFAVNRQPGHTVSRGSTATAPPPHSLQQHNDRPT